MTSSIASALGGYPLTVDRRTFWVTPYTSTDATLYSLLAGLALITTAIYMYKKLKSRPSIWGLGLVLMILEAILVSSLMIVKLELTPISGAFNYILVERSLWAVIGCLSIGALIVLNSTLIIAVLKRGFRPPLEASLLSSRAARPGPPRDSGQALYLLLAMVFGVLSVLIPHLPYFNPDMEVVSTDTYYNLRWIEVFVEEDSLSSSIRETADALRPLYMLFLYVMWRSTSWYVDPALLLDMVIPLMGFTLLAVTVYVTARKLGARYPGQASLAAVLYWTPFFVYGGFQTNLLALPMALAAYALLARGKIGSSALLLYLLGLWHPWTLVYYSTAALLYTMTTYTTLGGARGELLKRIAAVIAALLASLATLLAILAWEGSVESITGLYRPITPSTRLGDKLLFVFYTYVWGSMLRPEIHLPASTALLERRARNLWPLMVPSLGFIALKPVAAFRLLMEAPYPLAHGMLDSRIFKLLVLPVAASTWLYLIANSPPT